MIPAKASVTFALAEIAFVEVFATVLSGFSTPTGAFTTLVSQIYTFVGAFIASAGIFTEIAAENAVMAFDDHSDNRNGRLAIVTAS